MFVSGSHQSEHVVPFDCSVRSLGHADLHYYPDFVVEMPLKQQSKCGAVGEG